MQGLGGDKNISNKRDSQLRLLGRLKAT